MSRLGGDIIYRLKGGAKPTQSCTRSAAIVSNPQTRDYHNASFEFLGTDYFSTPTVQDFGISNAFTLNIWLLPRDISLSNGNPQTICRFGLTVIAASLNTLSLRIEQQPGDVESFFSVSLRSNSGVLIKSFRIAANSFFTSSNVWSMLTITWNGSSFLVYKNGVNETSNFTVLSNLNGSLSNLGLFLSVGANENGNELFTGVIHQLTLWSEALNQDAIRTIWGKGSGNVVLNVQQDGYVSQNKLEAWYLAGKNIDSPFFDFSLNGRDLVFSS